MATKKRAEIRKRESQTKAAQQKPETPRLSEALALHMRYHRVEGHTPRTLLTTEARLSGFVGWVGAGVVVTDVTSGLLMEYLGALQDSGLAEATVRGHWSNVRAFVRWLWRWEYLKEDPTRRIRPPKVRRKPKGFMPPGGIDLLLLQAEMDARQVGGKFIGARRAAMVWVVATAGLRLQELEGLDRADLDFEGARIAIRKAKGGVFRHAVFHAEAQKAVLKYMRFRHDRHAALWLGRERKKRLSARGIYEDMEALQKAAGVKVKDAMHVFRRNFAAEGIRQGLPREYVQAGGGWKTGAMLDHYAADLQGEHAAALKGLGAVDWRSKG